jgi:hypothetical protein
LRPCVIRSPAICRLVRDPHFGLRLLLPSLDADPFRCTCAEVVFLYMGILRSLRSWNNRLEAVEFCRIPEKKRNRRADRVRDAAAKGGFQVGQTAKARRGPPCAVTPAEMRTWPPALSPWSIEANDTTRNRWKCVRTGARLLMQLCSTRANPWRRSRARPTTLGKICGGVILVSRLNYRHGSGQVTSESRNQRLPLGEHPSSG